MLETARAYWRHPSVKFGGLVASLATLLLEYPDIPLATIGFIPAALRLPAALAFGVLTFTVVLVVRRMDDHPKRQPDG